MSMYLKQLQLHNQSLKLSLADNEAETITTQQRLIRLTENRSNLEESICVSNELIADEEKLVKEGE